MHAGSINGQLSPWYSGEEDKPGSMTIPVHDAPAADFVFFHNNCSCVPRSIILFTRVSLHDNVCHCHVTYVNYTNTRARTFRSVRWSLVLITRIPVQKRFVQFVGHLC